MNQQRHPHSFHKRSISSFNANAYYSINPDIYLTPYKQILNTISSQHTEQPNSMPFSMKSSIVADESECMRNLNMKKYQWQNGHKIETIDEETNDIIEKKDRQMYFLKIDLSNYEKRLKEKEEESALQQKQIHRLNQQLQNVMNKQRRSSDQPLKYQYHDEQYQKIFEQNEKLKKSINILMQQRNASLKNIARKDNKNVNWAHTALLKKQVEQLRLMIAEMQINISNCPSCFTLKRQNQQLSEAYEGLQKQYSSLASTKTKQEKNLLQNITSKIQENQNIVRQNQKLKQQKGCVTLLKFGRQRLKESVAKRCRTLTNQF